MSAVRVVRTSQPARGVAVRARTRGAYARSRILVTKEEKGKGFQYPATSVSASLCARVTITDQFDYWLADGLI